MKIEEKDFLKLYNNINDSLSILDNYKENQNRILHVKAFFSCKRDFGKAIYEEDVCMPLNELKAFCNGLLLGISQRISKAKIVVTDVNGREVLSL